MSQSTDITVFTAPSGDRLRVVLQDDEPWFLANDACASLDTPNVGQALSRLDEDEKGSIILNDGTPGNPHRAIVSEAGLYALILSSRKPEAKAFRRWITHDVLPTLRRTGQYSVHANPPAREITRRELALAVIAAEDERDAAVAALESARPAIEAHDAYLDASGSMPISVVAKSMRIGQNKMFAFLRAQGVLISKPGPTFNTPYQQHVRANRFVVINGTRERSDGTEDATYTTQCTPKGQAYIHALIQKHGRP